MGDLKEGFQDKKERAGDKMEEMKDRAGDKFNEMGQKMKS
jgi:hypothetical protein